MADEFYNSIRPSQSVANSNLNSIDVIDHFSLGPRSTIVHFQNHKIHIYGNNEEQIQLIQEYNIISGKNQMTLKKTSMTSYGLSLLRFIYSLVAGLVFAFTFVFSFQVILFLFLNMVADYYQHGVSNVVGAFLSIPIFEYGMASLMALSWTFVTETWSGHSLLRNLFEIPLLVTEWINFCVFLGVPSLSIIMTLFLKREDWWEQSATIWVGVVFAYMCLFSVALVVSETIAFFRLILNNYTQEDIREKFQDYNLPKEYQYWKQLILLAIYLRKRDLYSGVRKENYLITTEMDVLLSSFQDGSRPFLVEVPLYTRFTLLPFMSKIFIPLTHPIKLSNHDEIQDVTPIATNDNWSLERAFCRSKRSRALFLHAGPSAIATHQRRSTLICLFLGCFLLFLVIIAFMAWLQLTSAAVVFFLLFLSILCCFWPIFRSMLPLYKNLKRQEEEEEEAAAATTTKNDFTANLATYRISQTFRVTTPNLFVCYVMFGFEFIFLFTWPFISLFVGENTPIAIVFMALGTLSFIRLHCSIAALLPDLGSISTIKLQSYFSPKEQLRGRFLYSDLLKKTRGPLVDRWMYLYTVLFIVTILMGAMSSFDTDMTKSDAYKVQGANVVHGFEYPPQMISTGGVGNLPYETCFLSKGFSYPDGSPTMIQDWSFLAAVAFMSPIESQPILNEWFGPGKAIDEYEFVADYRSAGKLTSGVSYKLISFSDFPGYAVLTIRGSQVLLDWLVNAQLWSAAGLAQMVRLAMPFGYLWSPIYYKLVSAVNSVQTQSLKRASYYTQTTNFVNDMRSGNYGNGKFTNISVTGMSLGGGLGIITGAQTGASTVVISAPNAMMSRNTFSPPLTMEEINSRVLNVIPDRDIVPRIDDPGHLIQHISCTAPNHEILACHSSWRTVCEFAYQCGSQGRPILCWCATKYGYPKPIQSGNVTFEEACKDAMD